VKKQWPQRSGGLVPHRKRWRICPMAASTDARRLPEWADMQGLVLSSYPHLDQASYVLMAIDDAGAARQWLARMSDRVTSAFKLPESRQPRSPRTRHVCHLNVAFTSSGLQRLGGAIANFSDAFVEGIHGRAHRTTLLGDVGPSAPADWRWGGPESGIDLLVMVFAEEDAPLDEEVDEILPTRGLRVVVRQDARRLSTMAGREHLGFRDGISQPILRGSVDAERFPESIHLTELGEFVLGYPNADGIAVGERDRTGRTIPLPRVGECIDWGRNGTYLVLRQLEQHVDAFWNDMTERTADGGRADRDAANRLAAKFVGRTLDGTPMVPYGGVDDNEFVYGEDPHGDGCPLGAHVRRANPRDSFDNANLPFAPANNHRILRRGRSYVRASTVAAAADERGLLFLCLNADIERQFEFIQQNWINNPSFLGLTGERDPLIGSGPALVAGRAGVFTIAGIPAPICVGGLPRFVTVRGGGYFFLPGLAALKCLTCHA
jgi:Dyp-type peroxidase family